MTILLSKNLYLDN